MPYRPKGSSGLNTDRSPSGAMQWVKNRNNIIDNYLKKQVDHFEREKDLNISLIDQDRLDIHDFMKQLKKCDSDVLPESKHWLGERTASGKRGPPKPRNVYTAPPVMKKEEPERDIKTAPERDEHQRYDDFQFQSRPKPEMVQRTTVFYRIFMRRNQMAADDHPTWETDVKKPQEPRTSDAWTSSVGFQKQSSEAEREKQDDEDKGKARNIRKERAESHRTGRTSETTYDNQGKGGKDSDDLMKDILVRKYRKKRSKRKTLDERMAEFYQSVDQLKVVQEKDNVLLDWEAKRRWTVLTKGVKAALADSSDEDDDPFNMHTI